MENPSFRKLIALIATKENYNEILLHMEEQYTIKLYKIIELTTDSVNDLYQNMVKKFYINRKKQNEEFWYENELRIFIWLLFGYLFVFGKNITELSQEDWKFFSQIFNFKSNVFFEFQTLAILKTKQRPPAWTEEETVILAEIMNQTKFKNRWNSIARELYIKSGKKFFRNPKQCRERWMNHLDPSKIRTSWTPAEDIILLSTIKKRGKKWSLAVKELQGTRTEHMVKNRYKSLISNERKKIPEKRQSQIENILLKKLNRMQQKALKNTSTQIKIEEKDSQGPKESHFIEEHAQKKIEPSPLKAKEDEIKIEEEMQLHPQIEHYSFYEELHFRSPMHIPWKSQSYQNYTISLLSDDRIDLENHIYGYSQSQNESFLRF